MPKFPILLILIALCLAFCNTRIRCRFSIESLLAQDSHKLLLLRTINSKTYEYEDKGLDIITARYYEFYRIGQLKSYWFFLTMEDYTYNENYDTAGKLINSTGKPLVYKHVKVRSCCTVSCKYYFFTLNKQYD